MKWNHLPASGQLKDQNPILIEKFQIIWAEQGKAETERAKEREAKAKAPRSSAARPARRGRR